MDKQNKVINWGQKSNLQHLIVGMKNIEDDPDQFDWWSYDDSRRRSSINPEKSVGIGSISKSMTALGVLMLDYNSKISIDDPASDYIDIENKTKNPIKINHLLTHTSGRPNDYVFRYIIERHLGVQEKTVDIQSYDQILEFANSVEEDLCSEPGSTFFYYNTGYALLGHLIEEVTGQKFESYINEIIFEPLDMEQTCFANNTENHDIIEHYYPDKENKEDLNEFSIDFTRILNPAGGVMSSLRDMISYTHVIASDGVYDGNQVLPLEVVEELIKPSTKNAARTTPETPIHVDSPVGVNTGNNRYAKGIEHNETTNLQHIIGHHGDLGLSEAQFTISKDRILVSLSTPAKGGRNLSNFNLEFLAGTTDEDPNSNLSEILNQLAGNYKAQISNYGVTLHTESTHLTYEMSDGTTGVLIPDFDPNTNHSRYEFIEPSPTGQRKKQHIKLTDAGYVLYLDRNAYHNEGNQS